MRAAQTDDIYLVEIRLARTRWKIKETIVSLANFFGVSDSMERHPHVTLFGPFRLNDGKSIEEVIDQIGRIAAPHDILPFTIGDWETREGLNGGVVAFSVTPSDALRQVTRAIAGALSPISQSYNHWDNQPDKKWFHVTVANWLDPEKASAIYAALKKKPHENPGDSDISPNVLTRISAMLRRSTVSTHSLPSTRPLLLDEAGLRITIMCGQEIFAEYDLLRKTWIRGDELHDPASWQRTVATYRRHAGFELAQPALPNPGDIYLISDLHLGHANIIHYCSRPFIFSDVVEMDRVLLQNWNYTITPHDKVNYLGDLRYGRDAPAAVQYRDQLNGSITFIEGNHDDKKLDAVPSATLEYGNNNFLLIHDPADALPSFDGWVIHGHHHNNDLRCFPFVNFKERRINVSAEVLGYSPVGIQELMRIIREHECSGNREPILLRYPYIR